MTQYRHSLSAYCIRPKGAPATKLGEYKLVDLKPTSPRHSVWLLLVVLNIRDSADGKNYNRFPRPEKCLGLNNALTNAEAGIVWEGRAGRGRMFGILGLGFLLGMQHALEADHIAAVSSIAARRRHVADIVKHGLTWGLGHTLTLFAFAGAAILLGRAIPETIASPGRWRPPSG